MPRCSRCSATTSTSSPARPPGGSSSAARRTATCPISHWKGSSDVAGGARLDPVNRVAFAVEPIVGALRSSGYAIVEGVLARDQVAATRDELRLVLDAT